MEYTLYRDGVPLSICLRDFRESDALGIVHCIRDEYGSTYVKQAFYDPEMIIELYHTGKCKFLVVETSGEIAAIICLNFPYPPENMRVLWSTAIVLKKYRRYGMLKLLFNMAFSETFSRKDIASGCAFSITYHDITQRLMEALGFYPCGFLMAEFFNQTNSFPKDSNRKHHQVFLVRKAAKEDAGIIYVPSEHKTIAQETYDTLGVQVSVNTQEIALRGKTICRVEQDELQFNCTIWLDESGIDLAKCLKSIESKYNMPLQTFNVFLNISEPKAVAAYELLCQKGYFFTGWRPICCNHEIMLLHKPGELHIDFASLVLTEKAARLRDYVKNCYETEQKKS